MLQRALPFTLLLLSFVGLTFIPGYIGALVFITVALIALQFAVDELCNMLALIELTFDKSLAKLTATLLVLGAFSAIFPHVEPAAWEMHRAGIFAESFQIFAGLSSYIGYALFAIAGFLPWIHLVLTGVEKSKLLTVFYSFMAGAAIGIPMACAVCVYPKNIFMPGFETPVVAVHLLFMVACAKMGDTGAYLVGSLCHKISGGKNHKISPNISPNKSWEGAIGGMIFSVGMAFFLWEMIFHTQIPLWFALIEGIVLFWAGFFGDLTESVVKRVSGVKDSGKLFPGMGGILDVLDSLLIAAPVYVLMNLIYKICYTIVVSHQTQGPQYYAFNFFS